MGYGSITQMQVGAKKSFKFGRKITKPKRPESQNPKEKQTSHKFSNKKHMKLHYTQAFSP